MKTNVKALVIGESGCGKTTFAATFPKSYFLSTEPDGFASVENRPELLKNIVKQKDFIPSPIHDIGAVFNELRDSVIEAHKMAEKGEIETLVLDNITYLSENRLLYIQKYEPVITKTGAIDTQRMYGALGRWLYEFVLMSLCSFKGNVVVTSHIKLESEETMERKMGNDDIVANIVGGFRNTAPGMFSLVTFLDKTPLGNNKYQYSARLNKSANKLAKNRYNLPEVLENVSYQTIYNAILKSKEQVKQ